MSTFGRHLRAGRRGALLSTGAIATGLGLALAAPAMGSKIKEEFLPFADCPTATAKVCVASFTTGGEFVMGSKTVPISRTIKLQGGLESTLAIIEQPLIAAKDGNTLVPTALPLPGGLTGIEGLEVGGEVTATSEIAGPASSVIIDQGHLLETKGTAVHLPLKVHLQNELLGEDCYIGTDAEPIVLNLTTGTTSPPSPNTPITGKRGNVSGSKHGLILRIKESELVDNSFAAPAATGCGTNALLEPVVTALVNADAGLPSAAGKNTARMAGYLEQTESSIAVKYIPREKKAKKTKA